MSLIHPTKTQDPLLQELARCEGRLSAWLSGSASNASWFSRDPVSAMRAAGLGLDEETLRDLEVITSSIARKLNAVM